MRATTRSSVDVRHRTVLAVWTLRILVGAVFVISGWSKCVDLWGTVFKVGEYLAAWEWDVPRALVVAGALMLSLAEGVSGAMMMLGCYRRTAVWLMLAIMAFFLPLTAYIALYTPVSDCGCFGDFWVISNGATFWKNVAITAALVALLRLNTRVKSALHAPVQWVAGVVAAAYYLAVAVIGLTVQPMLDFRRFAPGTQIAATAGEDDDEEAVDYEFIYEKGGERRHFAMDELPDSTWTFVDRVVTGGSEAAGADRLAVYDAEGEDVTDEALDAATAPLMIFAIAQPDEAGPEYAAAIDDLSRLMADGCNGGRAVLLLGDPAAIPQWRQLLGDDAEIYSAEPTNLKELARGDASATYVDAGGTVVWKRSLASFAVPDTTTDRCVLAAAGPPATAAMATITMASLALLAVVIMIDHSGVHIARRFRRRTKPHVLTKEQ